MDGWTRLGEGLNDDAKQGMMDGGWMDGFMDG